MDIQNERLLLACGAQNLKAAWKKATNKQVKQIIKRYNLLVRPTRRMQIRLALHNLPVLLEHGMSSIIIKNNYVKERFINSVSTVVNKINALKKAIQENNVQRVCTLLQTQYLFTETLQDIVHNTKISNPAIKGIMQKYINLQSTNDLSEKQRATIFSDYIHPYTKAQKASSDELHNINDKINGNNDENR